MPISIKNPAVEELERSVAAEAGETLSDAIRRALEERLLRLRGCKRAPSRFDSIIEVAEQCAKWQLGDKADGEEILGYNDEGTFE